jgi:hypothetical protein
VPCCLQHTRLWEEWEEEDNTEVEEGDCIFVTKMYPEDILDERDTEHLCAMGSVATKLGGLRVELLHAGTGAGGHVP